MDTQTFLNNFGTIADAPNGIARLRELVVILATSGRLSYHEDSIGSKYPDQWRVDAARNFFESKSGNSKLIKGKLFAEYKPGRFPGYSASGQDVWLDTWEHDGEAAILSAVGARCGKAFQASGRWSAIANTHIIWLENEHVLPSFAMLLLNNENFWIRSGSAQPFVKVKASLEQIIGLPPLDEQEEIVRRVNELTALCDELETAKNKRDGLRTAARESAIDAVSTVSTPDELSAAWTRIQDNWTTYADTPESIASLRSLILRLAMQQKLLPSLSGDGQDKPRVVDLKEVLTLEYGKPLERQLRTTDGPVPAYGANGIKTFTEKPLVKTRGIVVGRKGSAGQVNITEGPFWPLDVTFFAQFDETIHDVRYLYYLLQSLDLTRLARGVKPGINRNDVHQLKVLKVSLDVQVETVGRVDELMTLCDELEVALSERNTLREKFASSVTHEVVEAA